MVMLLESIPVQNCHGQVIVGVKMLLFLVLIWVHNILVLGKGPIQGLDDTTLTAEAKYPITFTES